MFFNCIVPWLLACTALGCSFGYYFFDGLGVFADWEKEEGLELGLELPVLGLDEEDEEDAQGMPIFSILVLAMAIPKFLMHSYTF